MTKIVALREQDTTPELMIRQVLEVMSANPESFTSALICVVRSDGVVEINSVAELPQYAIMAVAIHDRVTMFLKGER